MIFLPRVSCCDLLCSANDSCSFLTGGRPKNATRALELQPSDKQHVVVPSLRGVLDGNCGIGSYGTGRGAKRQRSAGAIESGKQYIGARVAKKYRAHVDNCHPDGIWCGVVSHATRHATRDGVDGLAFLIKFEGDDSTLERMSQVEVEQAMALHDMYLLTQAPKSVHG